MYNEKKKIISPPKDPILIVEDDDKTQMLLQGLCKKMKLECEVADNGKVALEMLEKKSYSIFIVDLMMPVMDGQTFIGELKSKQPEAVVLVQTALDSSDTIIDIMKTGVFDYIIKPIDPELFQSIIWKSIEFRNLKDIEFAQHLNAGRKIRNQLEWLNYKESRRIADQDYTETKSIYTLKTSITQGAGFGSLVSIIDIIKSAKKDAGPKDYSIERKLIDMLIDNNDYCRIMIEGLHSISDLLENEYTMEKTTAVDIIKAIPSIIKDIFPFLEKKNITLTLPEIKFNCQLNINMEKISIALEELLINAYKYCVPGTKINILSHISEGYFWISVKNNISEKPYGGVPPEYEKMVIEPFFRLLPPDESIAKLEKFGLGLGLTVVDNILRKHAGLFMIHDVKDHTTDKLDICTMAEILIPVLDEK